MNTVKNREHIKEAYFNYNIRDFAFDTKEELQKIIETTNGAKDLTLYVLEFLFQMNMLKLIYLKNLVHYLVKLWVY